MATAGILRTAVAVLAVAGCAPSPAGGGPLADGSAAAITAAVDEITHFPSGLDPRLWNGESIKPEVADMTMRIVDRVVADDATPGLRVEAVEVFGSNASYEYDDASDFGVHVFTTSTALNPAELHSVLRLLNDDLERRQEGRITFNGVVLEVNFHGERTAGYRRSPGIGQYSLTEGRWIERPVKQPDNFDRTRMMADAKDFIGRYNDLVSGFEADRKGFDCHRFGELDDQLKTYRDSDFTQGLGSRSTANLTYRALRRLNVSVPDMLDRLADECVFARESIG